ncbi:hypothetical protein F5B22DRAFT_646257 [Xylaria bambusicola]|uniref:uncharacterized protein n=1 Tax=Xylaria bambusicola TaxID=326684 RepID=UPI002008C1B5|nr:uncharacterized protein F5B22DRAFT_646257 [Xylaria bambusicola]KAI0516910.1 hypothetical protein F5B22DRAFT_646257 [Xylaria bambusicola]
MTVSFSPRQLVAVNGETLKEFLGTATEAIAYDILRPHVPLPACSHVHDNGCGEGAVSSALFALHSGSNSRVGTTVRVSATDKDPQSLAALKARADREGWAAHLAQVVQVDSTNLSAAFATSQTFSHSVTNFVMLQAWPRDGDCAAEIYRTLRPGGLAIVTAWEALPTMAIFRHTYQRLHSQRQEEGGKDDDLPPILRMHWYGGEHVQKALLDAGFEEARTRKEHYETRVRVHDARRWCEIGWSICGPGREGWRVEDEENWDETINVALEVLVAAPSFELDLERQNSGWLTFTASAVVATK